MFSRIYWLEDSFSLSCPFFPRHFTFWSSALRTTLTPVVPQSHDGAPASGRWQLVLCSFLLTAKTGSLLFLGWLSFLSWVLVLGLVHLGQEEDHHLSQSRLLRLVVWPFG